MNNGTLLIVAGWAHTADDLAELAARLAPCSGVVHATSPAELLAAAPPPPHDNTPPPSADDTPPLSAYALALRARLATCVPPVQLLGWSMGAMIALEATCHPHAVPVSRHSLLAGTPRFCSAADYPCGVPPAGLRALRAGLRRNPPAALEAFYRDVAHPHAVPPALLEAKIARALAAGRPALEAGLDYLQQTDLRARLGRLTAPALLLHGRHDRIIPWEAGAFLHRHLPQSSWLTDEEAGHDLTAEAGALLDAINRSDYALPCSRDCKPCCSSCLATEESSLPRDLFLPLPVAMAGRVREQETKGKR